MGGVITQGDINSKINNTMKKIVFLATVFSFLLVGCNTTKDDGEDKNNTVGMEDISLMFSGISFTKAINNASKSYSISDSCLIVDAGSGTNYFISPDGSRSETTVPILLAEIDNLKPFTFTTRLRSDIEKEYDAGTVYIFIDNENWLKFAFERDEKKRSRIVTVRTVNSSDDNNHDIIGQDYVYLRISSNGKQIGYYYSLDGVDWNLARIYRNEYPSTIWLGISSQSPKEGNNVAYFDEMSLTESYISHHRLGQ